MAKNKLPKTKSRLFLRVRAENKPRIDVDHLADLINLTISSKEKATLASQLEETVDYIKILDKLKTEKIIPASQVTDLKNVSRPDEVRKAELSKNGYFATKRVRWE